MSSVVNLTQHKRHRPQRGGAMPWHSILFTSRTQLEAASAAQEPDDATDLNLDQIVDHLDQGRGDYQLRPWWYALCSDVATIAYRHGVWHDLEREEVVAALQGFAQEMRRTRDRLAHSRGARYRGPQQAWFLDAVQHYGVAVNTLAQDLASAPITCPALLELREAVDEYVDGGDFSALIDEADDLQRRLTSIRYCVHVRNAKITVTRYEDEADYSAQIAQTFAKFVDADSAAPLDRPERHTDMNHIEAQIEEQVERLFPQVYDDLRSFCTARQQFVDPAVELLDREVQFYLAYLDLITDLRQDGLEFCRPDVRADSKQVEVRDGFDLALALKLHGKDAAVVCNDVELHGDERIIVVSGPNQGGKTTFARAFGQVHHLAALGYPVPGQSARVVLPDRIYTHFEREENLQALRGKLEDELVRFRQILDTATSRSVVVVNEGFTSTTLDDARFLGIEILTRLTALDLVGVCVTFVDELSRLNDATISMTSTIVDGDPTRRTFKVVRREADGLAFAMAIAEKYGLSRSAIGRRLS